MSLQDKFGNDFETLFGFVIKKIYRNVSFSVFDNTTGLLLEQGQPLHQLEDIWCNDDDNDRSKNYRKKINFMYRSVPLCTVRSDSQTIPVLKSERLDGSGT